MGLFAKSFIGFLCVASLAQAAAGPVATIAPPGDYQTAWLHLDKGGARFDKALAPIDVPNIARACEQAGADALSLVNTFSGMAIDVRTRKSRISRPTGGVSGPAIHPMAVRMVWEAAQATSIPINGMGGIASWEDAAEMILAGATATFIHGFGDCPLRSPAVLSLFFIELAAMDGFLPRLREKK